MMMNFVKSLDWILLPFSVARMGDDDNKKGGVDVLANASPLNNTFDSTCHAC